MRRVSAEDEEAISVGFVLTTRRCILLRRSLAMACSERTGTKERRGYEHDVERNKRETGTNNKARQTGEDSHAQSLRPETSSVSHPTPSLCTICTTTPNLGNKRHKLLPPLPGMHMSTPNPAALVFFSRAKSWTTPANTALRSFMPRLVGPQRTFLTGERRVRCLLRRHSGGLRDEDGAACP